MSASVDQRKPAIRSTKLLQPLLVAPLRSAAPVMSGDRRQRGERRRCTHPLNGVERRRGERRETALQALMWASGAGR